MHGECLRRVEVVAGRSLVVLSGLCGGFMGEEWNDGIAFVGRKEILLFIFIMDGLLLVIFWPWSWDFTVLCKC